MKIVGINGSPRKNGNTAQALEAMAEVLQKEGIDTEIIHIGHLRLHGCTACGHCWTSENNQCVFADDIVNETANKMRAADGFILGSPTYYGGIAGTMKSFLDRVFFTSSSYFRYKVAAAFAVVRRAGGVDVVQQLNNYLHLAQTIIPPSQYWNIAYGMNKGEIAKDLEGMQTLKKNALAMAWLLKVIEAGKGTVPIPADEEHAMTNFVR